MGRLCDPRVLLPCHATPAGPAPPNISRSGEGSAERAMFVQACLPEQRVEVCLPPPARGPQSPAAPWGQRPCG